MEQNKVLGLQKKTKKELIDIILRKDDVHKNLNEVISNKDKEINTYNIDIKNLQKEIDGNSQTINKLQQILVDKENIIDDFKEGFDNQAYDIIYYKRAIKCHIIIEIILFIIILLLIF